MSIGEFVMSMGYQLKCVQYTLRTKMDDVLRPIGLTTPQYAVLSQLALHPGISNAALARASFITAQSMHGIVANLEKMGLLVRNKDPSHGRILQMQLTESGRKLLMRAQGVVEAVEREMLSSFSSKEKNQMAEMLSRCLSNLQ